MTQGFWLFRVEQLSTQITNQPTVQMHTMHCINAPCQSCHQHDPTVKVLMVVSRVNCRSKQIVSCSDGMYISSHVKIEVLQSACVEISAQ